MGGIDETRDMKGEVRRKKGRGGGGEMGQGAKALVYNEERPSHVPTCPYTVARADPPVRWRPPPRST